MAESELLYAQLIDAGKEMEEGGLIVGSIGNISVRAPDGTIAISSRSSYLGRLTPGDIVLLNADGSIKEGSAEPSSEHRMHVEVYTTRQDVHAVVHTHSPHASAYAFLRRPFHPVNPEAQYVLGTVPIVPFVPSGTQALAMAVAQEFGKGVSVVLMERHGVVTVGPDISRALNLAEMVEEVARITYLIDSIGSQRS